jgi:death-on-curing protein
VIRYLTLAEYLWLAEQVTGVDAAVLAKSSRSDLADSPAVLVCRLTWNHPLIDGNKPRRGLRWSCLWTSIRAVGIQILLT